MEKEINYGYELVAEIEDLHRRMTPMLEKTEVGRGLLAELEALSKGVERVCDNYHCELAGEDW